MRLKSSYVKCDLTHVDKGGAGEGDQRWPDD